MTFDVNVTMRVNALDRNDAMDVAQAAVMVNRFLHEYGVERVSVESCDLVSATTAVPNRFRDYKDMFPRKRRGPWLRKRNADGSMAQ